MKPEARTFGHQHSDNLQLFNPVFDAGIVPQFYSQGASNAALFAGGYYRQPSQQLVFLGCSDGRTDCEHDESSSEKLTETEPSNLPRPTHLQGNFEAGRGVTCTCKALHAVDKVCSYETRVTSPVFVERTTDLMTQHSSLAKPSTELSSNQVESWVSQSHSLKEEEKQSHSTQYLLEAMHEDYALPAVLDENCKHTMSDDEVTAETKQQYALETLTPKENPLCIEQTTQRVTKAIPIAATKLSIAKVIPGLKLQLSIGQDVSDIKSQSHAFDDVSLELKIGPQEASAWKDEYRDRQLIGREMPTQRRSGFSKWQRPCTQDVAGGAAECLRVPCRPIEREQSGPLEEFEGGKARMILDSRRPLIRTPPHYSIQHDGCISSAQRGIPYTTIGVPLAAPRTATLGVMSQGACHAAIGMPVTRFVTHTAPIISSTITSPSNLEDSTINMLQTAFPSVTWDQTGSLNYIEIDTPYSMEPPENTVAFKIEMPHNYVKAEVESNLSTSGSGVEVEECDVTMMQLDGIKDPKVPVGELDPLKCQGLIKMPVEIPGVHDATLVGFLRAKKSQKEHYLDKVIVSADVYQKHPWHYTGGDIRGYLYFCCNTKYNMRGNMTRDRMTREGGRWKQQGMVHPVLNVNEQDAALKTYMSYIPCGKNTFKGDFIPNTPGRVKHRHRMIEIALEEDLRLEKLFFKFKVVPKPFLVVCVLKKA